MKFVGLNKSCGVKSESKYLFQIEPKYKSLKKIIVIL